MNFFKDFYLQLELNKSEDLITIRKKDLLIEYFQVVILEQNLNYDLYCLS
jgi:hypothetical protein